MATGCSSPRIANPLLHQGIVDNIRATLLTLNEAPFPEHLMSNEGRKDGTDFNVCVLLKECPNLSLPPGSTLDWVYHAFPGSSGAPELYVRRKDAPPFITYSEYEDAVTKEALGSRVGILPLWSDDILLDETPESYLQLLIMTTMADQFHQFWHSCGETYLICTEEALLRWANEELPPSARQQEAVCDFNPTPRIHVGAKDVTVEALYFYRNEGVLVWERFRISRQAPRELLDFKVTEVTSTGHSIQY